MPTQAFRQDRIDALIRALGRRILVLDGAMGTRIQAMNLKAADFGGADRDGCNEHLVLTRPELISRIHQEYFEAGADIAETNTFGGTPLVLAEFGLAEKAFDLNRAAARLAREVADRFSTADQPRWVAGAMGPTTRALSVTGGVTFEELVGHFRVQAAGLVAGGVDYLLLETAQDTRNLKAALLGIHEAFAEAQERVPLAISGTIEATGTMLAGQSVEALSASLEHLDLLYLGLNCATGPEFMTDHLRSLSAMTPFRVACVPNAGLPDEAGVYLERPEMLARSLGRFAASGWVNLVGGCCGTEPAHIRLLAEAVRGHSPRVPVRRARSSLSGVDYLEVTDEVRPVVVGERTNVIGSKKFKDLIAAEKWEDAAEVARAQVKRGAQVIDVCLANPDRDERADMSRFLEVVVKKVRVPLMLDTTDDQVLAQALTFCQGKAIVNSVNLEEGEARFEKVVPLLKKFGAALVVGTIDEKGMAVTRSRKLEVAERSHALLVGKYQVPEEDLYFDPLVFPCASGDPQYAGSAVETLEGLRLVKQRFPRSKSVLGISNVSFGLPTAGREVLNSVFLYHCTQAGLDMALVNAEKLERYPSLPEKDRSLAEDLLFGRGSDAVAAFAAHFRDRKPQAAARSELPLEERLSRYIVEGSRDGLLADLDLALGSYEPLELINGPLMRGMDEVGRLFGRNELIVAEVLQSAEAMKAAVSHLEPQMSRAKAASRGKVLLATVKGDVHDIGKNLVEIILSNNGFEVVNLGIKVPPEQILEAVREHRPDVVGLSGLLVKSAHQMVATAEDLSRAGVDVPILVGGAALSRNFVDKNIAPAYRGTVAYAKDAMSGLELAKQLSDPVRREGLAQELQTQRDRLRSELPAPRPTAAADSRRSDAIRVLEKVPRAPDWERHVLSGAPLDAIWRFVNPVMLYGRHFGVKGSVARVLGTAQEKELGPEASARKALELRERMDAVKGTLRAGRMQARAVYRFFRAGSRGNQLVLFDEAGRREVVAFDMPRQAHDKRACLADFLRPLEGGKPEDNLCLFVVTAGAGIRELADGLKAKGAFLDMHAVQALALETAEGYAELLHSQIRSMWGMDDPPTMTMLERFRAEYAGKRFSFGYPACPNLEDQAKLFAALNPEEIGVRLTDGCMMEPEASVSALVFHHPDAFYFSVA